MSDDRIPPQSPVVEPLETPFREVLQGPVGASVIRVDGPAKITGAALYGGDMIAQRADVFVAVVRSAEPHAALTGIDTSAALRSPGVLGVYTAANVKGTNRQGLIIRDQPVLATDTVKYRGDAVALVTATTEGAARAAAALVKVGYKPLPVVTNIDEALAPGAPAVHENGNLVGGKRIRRGNAEAELRTCPIVIRETFHTQTVDHAFLDLEAGTALWDGSVLTLHTSGQWVHEEQRLTALALGLPIEAVRVVAPATGGAFGGREDLGIQTLLGLAALSHPNRVVALRLTREESMRCRHKRHPIRIDYTLGSDADGHIRAAKIVIYSEEGPYASTGMAVMRKAASHCTGPYLVPNVHCDVFGVYTNNNPKGAMRGFGAVQMAVAYEGMLDRLARKVGVSKQEIRQRNLIRDGEPVTTGQRIGVSSARECLAAAIERLHAPDAPAARPLEPHESRGVGMSTVCFGLGYGDGFPDASRARVAVEADDRVRVYTGAIDYGQGIMTAAAQIVAEELGLELGMVDVVSADSARTPEAGSTSASRQTYFSGSAIRLAATELRSTLLDVAGAIVRLHPNELRLTSGTLVGRYDANVKMPIRDLFTEARRRGYKLEGYGVFKPRTVCEDFSTGQSPLAFATYLFAAHVCQVVVDRETGQTTVERLIACHDVGKAINPQTVHGQISGGAAQGVGMALMEEVVMDRGVMQSTNFREYLLPTTRDLPMIESILIERDDPTGPFGAHGVGEPPVIASVPAVLSAIEDAIGIAPVSTPCTPEKVWRLMNSKA